MSPPSPNGFSTYRSNKIVKDIPVAAGAFTNPSYEDIDDLEVDYDNNVTDLYRFISNSQWQEALRAIRSNPIEAKTWVVRYHEDEDKGMMWRFLPIHSASARQPPEAVIVALLDAYPNGAECCDDQGKFALHYASGNQATAGVIRALLRSFPAAATTSDPEGKLPLHWMAISGPFEPGVIEPLVAATASKRLSNIVDDEGWTALDYAKQSDYPYKEQLMESLGRHNSPQQTRRHPGSFSKRLSNSSIPSDLSYGTSAYSNTYTSPSSGTGKSTPRNKPHPSSSNSSPSRTYNGNANAKSLAGTASTTNFSSNHSIRSIGTNLTTTTSAYPSTQKTITKLNAQIHKMNAEKAFLEAEHEEQLMNEREEHDDAVLQLDTTINHAIEKAKNVLAQLSSKEQYIAYKEGRLKSCSSELELYNEQNDKLTQEILELRNQLRNEQNVMSDYRMRITTLKSQMVNMSSYQGRISTSLQSIETDMKRNSDARRAKLQALFDEELRDSRELMEMKKVYGKMLGGPTIGEAVVQQKNLMKNCEAVLDECDVEDVREDDDKSKW